MIKLLFVDDQPVMLSFLQHCFSDTSKYQIVGSLTQAGLAELWCIKEQPDAVFMDIYTKETDTNGLETAALIRENHPDIKILLMTGFDEITYIPRAKEIGVHAFLLKSYGEEQFVQILDIVMQGGTSFPEESAAIPVLDGHAPLTDRQLEVLRLICEDFSNKEIAAKLNITESTVKRHVEALLEKTGKNSRAGLVAYAMAGGWINPII